VLRFGFADSKLPDQPAHLATQLTPKLLLGMSYFFFFERGCLTVNIGTSPKVMFSEFVYLFVDCLLQLKGTHEKHWQGSKD
jgi:hypothetical protein